MKHLLKKYDITQCAFYRCTQKGTLERLLFLDDCSLDELDKLISYYSFSRTKKDGSARIINAPRKEIKKIQKRILNLLAPINRPEWLISGERGKCYIDNGKYHQHSKYFLTIDIKKYYDNCKREYVFQFFHRCLEVSKDIACALTDIVTFDGGIATGCPTSQLIAYYAYKDMFDEIYQIAMQYGIKFTLYVDDMTFSCDTPFQPKQLLRSIDIVLRKYNHKPKYSKVKYYSKDKMKVVTGTAISPDNELLVTNNLRHKIYSNFTDLKKLKLQNTSFTLKEEKELDSLRGRLQAAKNVEANIFPEINRLTNSTYFAQ